MKFQNSSMHVSKVMLCIKKRDERTDERLRSNMPSNFFGWGHKYVMTPLLSGTMKKKIINTVDSRYLDLAYLE